jgi:peptidoglycan/xylan/chitin deacetylase (PgdA/CDA1 family)
VTAVTALCLVVNSAAVVGAGCGHEARRSAEPRQLMGPTVTTGLRPTRPRIVSPHDRPIPILMYHVVGPLPPDEPFPSLVVSRPDFAGQLRWLRRNGYHVVTLRQAYDYWRRGFALPRRPVVLSFDDGYPEDFSVVAPLLRRFGWPGVLNLEILHVVHGDLSPAKLLTLVRLGWEIDAHTITHPDLTTVDATRLWHEVAGSRAWIRRVLRVPADFFAYPSGRYDAQVIAAVRAAGFLGAVTENYGEAAPGDGMFTLDRLRVDRSDGVAGVAAKLSASR